MPRHISLDGEWQLAGQPPNTDDAPLRLTARTPGHVHTDLMRAGHIPDPFWREQAEACQWVEGWEWRYSRAFVLGEADFSEWMALECEGLDTIATIYLNGHEVGKTANMFIPQRFSVRPFLRQGENYIEICFTPIALALVDKPAGKYEACFAPERVFLRKTQCSFGWDWVHRFVSYGIWRSIGISAYDRARIADVYCRTVSLSKDVALLRVETDIERFQEGAAHVEARLFDPNGSPCATDTFVIEGASACVDLAVAQPRLWWPNGYGAQPLYSLEVRLTDDDGNLLDKRTVTVGIRTIALEQIPDTSGASFTIMVNGQRIFCKGGNWVPASPFPATVNNAHYDQLIRLAKEARMTMLRSWGGGIYEPPAFWDACNRYGILIMQDFLLACARYPEDDATFLDALRVEFEAAIRMLRNHPALALWSGDNELGMNESADSAYNGRAIAEQVSEPLCAALDPSTPYQKTSPYGGDPNNAAHIGDCHVSAWYNADFHAGDMDDYRKRIRDTWGRFASEYVTVGLPRIPTMLRFAAEEDLRDPTARVLAYHTKDNPYNGIDHSDHYHLLKRTAERLYGIPDDPVTLLRRMAYAQYEWNRLVCESLRRRMFDCSGLLFWMYNDCWPANGCSAVDFYGIPKAGYYGMKAGFRPVIACIEPCDDGSVRVWVSNDTFDTQHCNIVVYSQPWTGPAQWRRTMRITAPPMTQQWVATIPARDINGAGALVCDLLCNGQLDRATYVSRMPRDMAVPDTAVTATFTRDSEEGGTVTVQTEHYARVVCIEGDILCSDNYFDLVPGETRTLNWRLLPQRVNDAVSVSWWNGGDPPLNADAPPARTRIDG